ncbi:MAG: GNAT family N-acetyltransferase [Acidobacteriota bacterium]
METTDRLAPPSGYPPFAELIPAGELAMGRFALGFARTLAELDEVLRLRYEVFNLELGEGLAASHETGRDLDPYDAQCHHLLVRDVATGRIAGTYRLQTSEMAAAGRGFYSAGEFELDALPIEVLENAVEAGRACVARAYRNKAVLFLLWRGMARYLAHTRKRYLFGCSSLTSQDPAEGTRMLRHLEQLGVMHPALRVPARPGWRCEIVPGIDRAPAGTRIPRLFRSYLRVGARVCSEPAIDRQFGTIDFLMLFDVETMDRAAYAAFFADLAGR